MTIKFLIFPLLLLLGCEKNQLSQIRYQEVDSLVNLFIKEASKRGVKINADKNGLRLEFGRVKVGKSASCKPNSYPKVITIDSVTWKHINPEQKESLIFHELAHCLMMRPHNNEAFEFGECKSWMREDESKCNINLQNPEWRKYYLEELFRQSKVQIPYWYSSRYEFFETDNHQVTKKIKIRRFEFQYFDSIFLNTPKDWIIQINCSNPATFDRPSIGLSINELLIETFFSTTDDKKIKPRIVIINNNPRKVVVQSTSENDSIDLSFQKFGKTLFIYFGENLKYRVPVNNTLKMGAYCSFPEDHYSINWSQNASLSYAL